MSVQFRTRSQTSVNYSDFVVENSQNIGCCYVYNSETNTVSRTSDTTWSDCNQLNGYFVKGNCDENLNITPSSLGCCCACALKADPQINSYLKTTTFCECNEKSGNWTLGECPDSQTDNVIEQYCISEFPELLDYREKRACCYPEFTLDGVAAKCEDVCTEKECAEKAIFPYDSTFYSKGRKCNVRVGEGAPVADECVFFTQGTNVVNACTDGSNTYCWQLSNPIVAECRPKSEQDSRFPGTFVKNIDLGTYLFDTLDNKVTMFAIDESSNNAFIQTATFTSTPIKCEHGTSGLTNRDVAGPGAGYFAVISRNETLTFYKTFNPNFDDRISFLNWPTSPVPQIPHQGRVIDVGCSDTFSVVVNGDNTVKVYGAFYSTKIKEFRSIPSSQLASVKLKKVATHKLKRLGWWLNPNNNPASPDGEPALNVKNVGFVAQKLDNSLDYYSPFIGNSDESWVSQFRDKVRSMPKKEYKQLALGNVTLCGIDSDDILHCVSLYNDLSVPNGIKAKAVTCSNLNDGGGGNYSSNDFIYAVGLNNQILRYNNPNTDYRFENQPISSITPILDISCTSEACTIVVEPDEAICNGQVVGSCCVCNQDNTVDCSQTQRVECEQLNGNFQEGGICCSVNNTANCVDCIEIEGLCNSGGSFLRITQSETDLPSNTLEYFKDGLYVDIFKPGFPINSDGSVVRGAPSSGKAINYTPTINGFGTQDKKWGIVIAPTDYELGPLYDNTDFTEIIPGSLYDGMWNTYGDLNSYYGIQSKSMETLRNKSRLSGWYLPSKNELEFINKKIIHNFIIPDLFAPFKDGLYLTSTPYFTKQSDTIFNVQNQKFNGNSFNYAQSFRKSDYGDTYLVSRRQKVYVRLIRRIELE